MLSVESPLTRLPSDLPAREAMFYDGVRFAIEMLNISYHRLVSGLDLLSVRGFAEGLVPGVMLDAWAIVDSADRLRKLLSQAPNGVQRSTPGVRDLRAALEPCHSLRNDIQHLEGTVIGHAANATPTWGGLSWLRLVAEDGSLVQGFSLIPGGIRRLRGAGKMPVPMGRSFGHQLDHVTLTAYGTTASLSDVFRAVEVFVDPLERTLAEAWIGKPVGGSDLLATIEFELEVDPESTGAGEGQGDG
ncbi:hypothetical protein ACFSBZ_08900 [Amnibacterium flavum]|uniref:Uncharacterized protein n=1 Tax=Amnibacterium flavum TaxID=2173173 RepID=A0A2V1HWS6_9MICO|nr:hypothetical protein [Amnibacterium flavum]PVZ94987.1 hypothetical protein DDQ50_00140 [Amnibacterium flavum]